MYWYENYNWISLVNNHNNYQERLIELSTLYLHLKQDCFQYSQKISRLLKSHNPQDGQLIRQYKLFNSCY